jgi:ribosomal-protein-alanine N-acetyltransferase
VRAGQPGNLFLVTIDVEFGSPLPPIEIVGDRHRLRPFRPEDIDLVEEASRDDFIPLITSVPSKWTPHEGQAFIDRQNSRLSNGEGWSLAIVDQTSGRAVGQIGLWISHLHKGRADIGYWVAASGRGQGTASLAVQALSDWAFESLDVDRLSLFIEPWNTASIKTAERAGYELEGLLRDWERVGGMPRDMGSYARTRSYKTG